MGAVLMVAGVVFGFVVFALIVVLQQRLLARQAETIEKLRRACERERAGRQLVMSELRSTVDAAKVVSLWDARVRKGLQ